jgi:succinate dehydrogenase/fumarate reductase cytochrome b subunit
MSGITLTPKMKSLKHFLLLAFQLLSNCMYITILIALVLAINHHIINGMYLFRLQGKHQVDMQY